MRVSAGELPKQELLEQVEREVLTAIFKAVLFASLLQRPTGYGSERVTQVVE